MSDEDHITGAGRGINQGSRGIVNTGQTGNIATGDNHPGGMQATVAGQQEAPARTDRNMSDEDHITGAGRGINQGSRGIVNTGQTGNIATGDNHAGGMQATVAGQQEAPARTDRNMSDEDHITGAGRGINQGSRGIVNTGQTGNIATGDNHAGGMQATVAGQQEAPARTDRNMSDEDHITGAGRGINQGSRGIVNTGQTGNIATGDNHAGGMQATVAGQQEAPARTDADGSGQGQEAPYKMDSVPRGLCYIFSNKTFENKPDKKRIGVEKDRDALTKVWEKLHFVVKSFDDSNANVMETRLKELAEMDHKAYNCVVVIFLTHGRDGAVQGSDNEWLEVSTITSYFKASVCPSLANKPKLFFFQSCRGNERQKAVPVQGDGGGNDVVGSEAILVKMVAPNADFFFGFATVAGMQALRNAETGSWFIQSLVQALEASTKRDDLDSIMTTVRRKVDDHQCETSDGKFLRQTAEVRSTLRKKLYFTY